MSFTVIDDNGTFEIRASIKDAVEMCELLHKLEQAKAKLEGANNVDIGVPSVPAGGSASSRGPAKPHSL